MYSLELPCHPDEVDRLSAEFWEAGTLGIRELEMGDNTVCLIAGFAGTDGGKLLSRFAQYNPQWRKEADIDWVNQTGQAWPGRKIGQRFFVCPPWCEEETPAERIRLIQNPGTASGTGEHPCTQLGLGALELTVTGNVKVADVGTGSGILAIAALQLGAAEVIGLDRDEEALQTATENFKLNQQSPQLAVGSADTLRTEWSDITVANISGTVLLAIMDDMWRSTRPGGTLILTGFTGDELSSFQSLLTVDRVLSSDEWRCVIASNQG